VGAEGLWSKAQKDAAYSLQKYAAAMMSKTIRITRVFLKYL